MNQTPDKYLDFLRKLNENDIDYWLDFGAALLSYRNGYIPVEEDLDIGVWACRETIDSLDKIIQSLSSEVKVGKKTWKNNLMSYKFVFKEGSLENLKEDDNYPIDIKIYRKYKQYAWTFFFERRSLLKGEKKTISERTTNFLYRNLKNLVGCDFWMWRNNYLGGIFIIPIQFFEKKFKKEISGCEISLPGLIEEFLSLHYGENWQKPEADWQFSTDDGTLFEVNSRMLEKLLSDDNY